MDAGKSRPSIHEDLLPIVGPEGMRVGFKRGSTVFSQGAPADNVLYILEGKVKLTVLSKQGKEAIIGVLNGGSFIGEGCLAGQPRRMAEATAITECLFLRIPKNVMIRLLRRRPEFAALFVKFLLAENIRYEEDLVDQLFNSSEKRLARILLLLSRFGREGKPEKIIPKISQEDLAKMVGTTRSRVNHFMNKFKSLGFIHYNGGLAVHSSLLNVVLHD